MKFPQITGPRPVVKEFNLNKLVEHLKIPRNGRVALCKSSVCAENAEIAANAARNATARRSIRAIVARILYMGPK